MSYKIAMYTRLSKEDKKQVKIESESIVNQKNLIKNFINNNDELIGSEVVSYSDDGYVGSNFERPAIKQLLEDARKGKIDCIIVKDLSRFGRNYIEVNNYLDKVFPFLNVRFIAINDNYDSKNNKYSTTDLDVSFKNILYSYYSKDLSLKVKTGLEIKAKQGNYISSYAPFGYKKNNETKRLEIDEETAPIVKMIFDLALKNNNYSEICKVLNDMKIPTKSEFKVKNDIRKEYTKKMSNKIWKRNDVRIILNNEVYIGNTITFKQKRLKCGSSKIIKNNDVLIVENTHEPIISKEIFQRIKPKIRLRNPNMTPKNIFAYKLKCGHCGYSLKYIYLYKDKNVIDKKYYCFSSKETDSIYCDSIKLLERELKQIIFESLKKEILLYLEENNKIKDKNKINNEIKKLEKNYKDLISSRRLLYEDYISEKITKEDYLKIKKEKEVLINEIKDKIEVLNNKSLEDEEIQEEIQIFKKYLKEEKLNKGMLDIFVNKIYIYDENKIKIEWKFKKY